MVRRLPDGHRIVFSLADMSHEARAEHIGWATLAVLLLLTALAYAWVRHMLRPLVALRAGAVRYGQGDFSQPIVPRNRDELGDLAEQINGMAARLHHMLDAKRQLLLAISHELRSPLARARMNAELVDESIERSALLRDLGEMRDLITDLLESERLADVQAGGHAALQTEPATCRRSSTSSATRRPPSGTVTLQLDDGAARAAAGSRPHAAAAAQPRRQRAAPRRRGGAAAAWCRRRARRAACSWRCATSAPAWTRASCSMPPRRSTAPTPRACAAPAASAWGCTCAGWWPRRTAARSRCATRIRGWRSPADACHRPA